MSLTATYRMFGEADRQDGEDLLAAAKEVEAVMEKYGLNGNSLPGRMLADAAYLLREAGNRLLSSPYII